MKFFIIYLFKCHYIKMSEFIKYTSKKLKIIVLLQESLVTI